MKNIEVLNAGHVKMELKKKKTFHENKKLLLKKTCNYIWLISIKVANNVSQLSRPAKKLAFHNVS